MAVGVPEAEVPGIAGFRSGTSEPWGRGLVGMHSWWSRRGRANKCRGQDVSFARYSSLVLVQETISSKKRRFTRSWVAILLLMVFGISLRP